MTESPRAGASNKGGVEKSERFSLTKFENRDTPSYITMLLCENFEYKLMTIYFSIKMNKIKLRYRKVKIRNKINDN